MIQKVIAALLLKEILPYGLPLQTEWCTSLKKKASMTRNYHNQLSPTNQWTQCMDNNSTIKVKASSHLFLKNLIVDQKGHQQTNHKTRTQSKIQHQKRATMNNESPTTEASPENGQQPRPLVRGWVKYQAKFLP